MKYLKLILFISGVIALIYISPMVRDTMTKEVPEDVIEDGSDTEELLDEVKLEVLPEKEEVLVEEVPEYKGVLVPSNLTSEELEKGLLHDLKQYAPVFIQAEQETGINAIFLASVSALESGWARSNVTKKNNNIFGWTSSKGYKTFNSVEECILEVAGRIKALYLTEGGTYFNGYEVEDINVRYNGRKEWEDNVNSIMRQIKRRVESE